MNQEYDQRIIAFIDMNFQNVMPTEIWQVIKMDWTNRCNPIDCGEHNILCPS